MFDVGIVLAVGFLLAALASLNLTGTLTKHGLSRPAHAITAPPSAAISPVPPSPQRTVGNGKVVGKVYRLNNGRLVYVVPSSVLPTARQKRRRRPSFPHELLGRRVFPGVAHDRAPQPVPHAHRLGDDQGRGIPTAIATAVGLPSA